MFEAKNVGGDYALIMREVLELKAVVQELRDHLMAQYTDPRNWETSEESENCAF